MPRTDRNKQIAGLYAEGKTIDEIADILGYKKPEYVRAFLRDHNLLKEPPEIGIDVPKVLALQKTGWHMTNIVREFGMKYTAEEIMEEVEKYGRRRKDDQQM